MTNQDYWMQMGISLAESGFNDFKQGLTGEISGLTLPKQGSTCDKSGLNRRALLS